MIQAGTIRIGSGLHLRRLRRILDQFDQVVAKHHLTGRAGQILADLVALGGRITLTGQRLHDVMGKMRRPFGQVAARRS